MTYLTKSLIALIIAGATLLIGATTALAQDTESTEEEIINPVDPLVCGDQSATSSFFFRPQRDSECKTIQS